MNHEIAYKIFDESYAFCNEHYWEEIKWASGIGENTFKYMKSKQFLSQYCWVVYASGFKESILREYFPAIMEAFNGFDLASLSKKRTITNVLKVFNNERKALNFLEGSKLIAKEGFGNFKRRLKRDGIETLEELKGIGKITKYHLAKNIGFFDTEKPDRWLVRIAELCNTTVKELIDALCVKYQYSRHVIDIVLWRYATENNIEIFIDFEKYK